MHVDLFGRFFWVVMLAQWPCWVVCSSCKGLIAVLCCIQDIVTFWFIIKFRLSQNSASWSRPKQYSIKSLKVITFTTIIIDEKLSWSKHYNYIANKLSKAAGILCRIRHYINKKTLINLYYSFVYPYLKYGITAWGNQTKSIMRKLQIIQNKIIRIMDFKFLKDCVKTISIYK